MDPRQQSVLASANEINKISQKIKAYRQAGIFDAFKQKALDSWGLIFPHHFYGDELPRERQITELCEYLAEHKEINELKLEHIQHLTSP